MSHPITEVAFVPMVQGADLTDPDNFAYKIVKFCGETTRRQPGFERGVWGVLKQEPQVWVTLTDWDELASHERFTKTAEHDEELEAIAKINDQPLEVFHINMECQTDTTADNKVRSSIIDIVTGYFPVEKAKTIISRSVSTNEISNGHHAPGIQPDTYAEGWAIEDDGPVWSVDGVQGGRLNKPIEKPWCGIFGWSDTSSDQAQKDYVMQKTKWIEDMGGERVVGRVAFMDY